MFYQRWTFTDRDLLRLRLDQHAGGISNRTMKIAIGEEDERDGEQNGEDFHSQVGQKKTQP